MSRTAIVAQGEKHATTEAGTFKEYLSKPTDAGVHVGTCATELIQSSKRWIHFKDESALS